MSYNPLKIGTYTVPTAEKEGYEVIRNKVWSKNTGRSANGTMTGDIVALKYTVRQKITEMTQTQVTALVTALSASAFLLSISQTKRGSTHRVHFMPQTLHIKQKFIETVQLFTQTFRLNSLSSKEGLNDKYKCNNFSGY